MRVAIADWAAADKELDNLTELADQLHAETFSDQPNPQRCAASSRKSKRAIRAYSYENHFSATLAEVIAGPNLLNLLTVGPAPFSCLG